MSFWIAASVSLILSGITAEPPAETPGAPPPEPPPPETTPPPAFASFSAFAKASIRAFIASMFAIGDVYPAKFFSMYVVTVPVTPAFALLADVKRAPMCA